MDPATRRVASWGKPLPYPVLIAHRRNNRLLEVPPERRIVREFPSSSLTACSGNVGVLDHPSLARDQPGAGDVIVADDLRHRVVVIDRKTKKIIWQYGVTDAPGYLLYPDGFDLDVLRGWKAAAKPWGGRVCGTPGLGCAAASR